RLAGRLTRVRVGRPPVFPPLRRSAYACLPGTRGTAIPCRRAGPLTIQGDRMAANAARDVAGFMEGVRRRSPNEPEFHQAVQEFAETVMPFALDHAAYVRANILERVTEPDRAVMFRVCWEDKDGNVRMNRGYRVQFNKSIGPYKGGLRFHPTVTLSILKF